MQKTKLPPVDMRHVCKYTEEIIEKLKKKNWSYHKSLNMWVNPTNTCGFMHQKDSFTRITETSIVREFFTLSTFSIKTWKELQTIYYASGENNEVFYGICPEFLIEIVRVLRKRFNKTTMCNIILGFPVATDDIVIVFVPYKDDYARFCIAPQLLNDESYRGGSIISGHSYIEPNNLLYDVKKGIIGALYKGKIITIDDYKAKWVEHILSNS